MGVYQGNADVLEWLSQKSQRTTFIVLCLRCQQRASLYFRYNTCEVLCSDLSLLLLTLGLHPCNSIDFSGVSPDLNGRERRNWLSLGMSW